MNNTGTKKGQHYEINGILKRKNRECAACLKN
jgi:ribosomal protein S27AE